MEKGNFVLLDIDTAIMENQSYIILVMKNIQSNKKEVFYDPSYRQYFYVIPKSQDKIKDLKDEINTIRIIKKEEEIKPLRVEIVEKIHGLKKIKVVKVTLKKPSHYLDIKDRIKQLPSYGEKIEKDIPFTRNYLADMGLGSGKVFEIEYTKEKNSFNELKLGTINKIVSMHETESRVEENYFTLMAIDIETVQENGKDNIIMVSYATNKGDKGIIYIRKEDHLTQNIDSEGIKIDVSSEKEIIEKLSNIICEVDPDIIFTYNGDEFDFDIIRRKIDAYSLNYPFGICNKPLEKEGRKKRAYKMFGRIHFDLYKFISRIIAYTLNVEILSLDAVASELIGEGKKDVKFTDIYRGWESNDLEKIIDYCLNDSLITLKLGIFLLPTFLSLSDITKLPLYDISRSTYGNLVESYAIRRGKKEGILIPNKPQQREVIRRYGLGVYEGAYVVEPRPGLYENIAVMDFRSLYPSIIITHNIDPFTLSYTCENNKNKVPDFDYCFIESPRGFIPSAMYHIYNKRVKVKEFLKKLDKNSKEYKFYKAKDYSLKTILNSFYGYLGYINSRWYKRECAQAATSFGRYYIKKIISTFKQHDFEVIYGDTDSVFVLLDNKKLDELLFLMKKINDSLPGIIKLDFQGFYKRGIFVKKKEGKGGAKKRYALIDEKGNILIRGFERVRRDWSLLAKKTQEMVLRYVLEGRIEDAKEYVREVIQKLKNREVDKEDLIIYVKLQKSLENYEVNAPHISVAKKLKSNGKKIFSGMIIPYIITSRPGRISDKAEIYYNAKDYDVDYYINNQVLPAALRVLESLNISKKELLGKGIQKKLF